jgi:hypothetical protein
MPMHVKDRTGCLYGDLRVVGSECKKSSDGKIAWECECSCGKVVTVKAIYLQSGRVKSCGHGSRLKTSSNSRWQGHGEISTYYWNRIKDNASKRGLEFKISIEEAWELFISQDRKCALSGVQLVFPETSRGERTASLDRIDSSKGYTLGNIQWVHKTVNSMKMKMSDSELIKWATLISDYRK